MDLQKAFDSLNWDFIFAVLSAMRFPSTFVAWVKECITTARFSISINGGLIGFFKEAKGIR